MKNYKQYDVKAYPFNPELLNGILWELEIDGITEEEDFLSVYAKEDSDVNVIKISSLLNRLKEEKLLKDFSVTESILENKNWNAEWESQVNVIEVSDKVVIKPSFREYDVKPGQVIIEIDPKMSFGTGEHETTKLMLLLLEKYMKENYKVLDVGCGTGILAIGAAKLADTKFVLGVDNDEWCLLNGNENVELNNLQDKVKIQLGELKNVEESEFDLIVANINKLVLLKIADQLKTKMVKNGTLLLSGLLISDKEDIVSLYKNAGFELIDEQILNEWISFVFKSV